MSVNPHRGEVAVVLDGRRHVARLTLGALAALEAEEGGDDVGDAAATPDEPWAGGS